MVRKQLSMERKAHALALLEQGMPLTRVAEEVGGVLANHSLPV